MIVKLNKRELFWCLINPQDTEEILVVLNESHPEESVEFDRLPKWAKDQIASSTKLQKISTEPDVILVKEVKTPVVKQVKESKKKVSKKVTAKALVLE